MADEKEQESTQTEEKQAEEKQKLFAFAFTKKQLRATLIAFAVMLGFCIYGHTNILLAVMRRGVLSDQGDADPSPGEAELFMACD